MSGWLDEDRPGSRSVEGDARRNNGRLEFYRDGAWRQVDDFSTDPRLWSWRKLASEVRNGMPAVVAEHQRRIDA